LRVSVLNRLRRVGGRIKTRLSRRALILLYHRVAETISDPWDLTVTPQHFAEHLQVLTKYGRVIPLGELSFAIESGSLRRRSVVVTFDDGYADNLLNAKPLLERYDTPATVFIATGCVDEGREFWWDELDRLFLRAGRLPSALSLSVRGNTYQWELGEAAEYGESSQHRNLKWRAWQEDSPSSRHALYRSLWQLLHPMAESERRPIRDKLLKWAGAMAPARPAHRALSSAEIVELARGGLVEIGCHTVTHPQLSALNAEQQRDEIYLSKSRLEQILDRPVSSFAYPYGRDCDYTNDTVQLVQEAGFVCACSTAVGVARQHADRFRLPRLQVQDMDGEAFARLLSEWLCD